MAKITEKAVRTAILAANQNSKHLLVGLQMEKTKDYVVNVVARKTGTTVQAFTELSASEAHEAITMFDLVARVTALQINGLAGALERLIDAPEGEDCSDVYEALTKFRGRG